MDINEKADRILEFTEASRTEQVLGYFVFALYVFALGILLSMM